MTILEIYTDGSLGNRDIAGLGWLTVSNRGPRPGFNTIKVSPAFATIDHVELQALKAAIKDARDTGQDMRHAAVYTDSLNAIELIRTEIRGHGRGRPTTTSVRNRELIKWLAAEVKINALHLRHVKSHNGDPGNDAADRLAVMARRNKEYGLDRNHGHGMAAAIKAEYVSALTRSAEKHWASPAAISLHRASGEPLCDACKAELTALEREAS